MTCKTSHRVLCQSKDFDTAKLHVSRYFKQSMLLNYDSFTIDPKRCCCATDEHFWQEIEVASTKNKAVLNDYIDELRDSGCTTIADLESLSTGYQSKLVHLIAHFVDGFIGIDSHFFSLPEDSHWISEALKEVIAKHPERYWLLHVAAESSSFKSTALLHHLPPQ